MTHVGRSPSGDPSERVEPRSPRTGRPSSERDLLTLALTITFGLVLAVGGLGSALGEVAAQDPDVWWVAASGRLGSLVAPIHTNTFSFTAPEHPWVFHEHLAGPLYAAGIASFGTRFLAILSLAGLLGTAAFVLWVALRWRAPDERERLAGLLLALSWCLAVGLHGMNARVTILARLLPLAFVALGFGERFGRAHAAALVGLSVLWANLHGSFPLGVAILAAAGLEGHRRACWATALVCALASFVTPHGLALHTLVADYLTGRAETLAVVHEYVREFQPLWSVDPREIVPELLALAGACTLALLGLRSHSARALLLLLLVFLALRNQRHLPLVLLLAVPLLRPVLAVWLPRGARLPWRPIAILGLGPAVALGLLAAWRAPAPPARGGPEFDVLVARLPTEARVYVPVDMGGRLAWSGFPGARTFADPRNDCYPADVLREAYELGRPDQDPEWIREVLARRDVTHVLDRAGSDVARALDNWTFLGREGAWVLLEAPAAMASEQESARPPTGGPHPRLERPALSRPASETNESRARTCPR